jgi:hypothetical protein
MIWLSCAEPGHTTSSSTPVWLVVRLCSKYVVYIPASRRKM